LDIFTIISNGIGKAKAALTGILYIAKYGMYLKDDLRIECKKIDI